MQDEGTYNLIDIESSDLQKLELCSSHYHACWRDTYRDRLPEHAMEELLEQSCTNEIQSWIVGEGKRDLLVVYSEQGIVGSAACNCVGNRCYVWGMYVLLRYQRTGVGGMLMEGIVKRARESDSMAVELTVLESSEGAVEFYKSNGFVQTTKSAYEITSGLELSSLTLELVL